jgi:hypothetical protein
MKEIRERERRGRSGGRKKRTWRTPSFPSSSFFALPASTSGTSSPTFGLSCVGAVRADQANTRPQALTVAPLQIRQNRVFEETVEESRGAGGGVDEDGEGGDGALADGGAAVGEEGSAGAEDGCLEGGVVGESRGKAGEDVGKEVEGVEDEFGRRGGLYRKWE